MQGFCDRWESTIHCRIGSLEKRWTLGMLVVGIHCRIGSLEKKGARHRT